jgi:hypothetical protein
MPAEVKPPVAPAPKPEYGPGLKGTRPFVIGNPGVTINGRWMIGRKDLTHSQKAQVQAMLSARNQHEIRSRVGDKEAERVINLGVLGAGNSGNDY